MSTTPSSSSSASSSSSSEQLGSERIREVWTHWWKHSPARNRVFLQICDGSWDRKSRVCVSAGVGLDPGKLPTKSEPRSTFGRWGRKNAHDTVTMRADFRKNRKKLVVSVQRGIVPICQCRTAARIWSICCGAPAIRVAKLWQNALAPMREEKHLLCRIAAGGCQTPCNSCAKGSFGPS